MNPDLEILFPNLKGSGYEVTSPTDRSYNCLAWAAEDNSRWWWPDEFNLYYWPEGAPRSTALDSFVQAFRSLGFEVCDSPNFESGWEKVALFANEKGEPAHAARQLGNGAWTSKLGKLEDIQHPEVDQVGGGDYGKAVIFLRRRRG